MKRFVRRQAKEDHQLDLTARAEVLEGDLLSTSDEIMAIDATTLIDTDPVLTAPPRSLDQMWGLE